MEGERMEEDRIEMSQAERDRLKVMAGVLSGERTQSEAGRLLRRSVRQVRRLQRRLEREGDRGVIHRLRGRPSNRQKAPGVRGAVLEAYRQSYHDFGPTFASEKLADEGLVVARETLRRWLQAEGLLPRRRKRDKHRSRRPRRACFGELVQADGSHHDWLEGRGPWMVLLVMIDDATSKAMARFYAAETTEGYMDLLERYLRKHGRMVAMYTDRHSIFWGQAKGKQPARTQVTRALKELGIEWIGANSPQAKGRVERFNGTAQDRLVKELRLAEASTMDEANDVLDRTFLPWFNRWCTVKSGSPNDAHRPVDRSMDLAAILSVQQRRKVTNDYTIRLDNQIYQLLKPVYPGQRGGWVTVEQRRDGTVHIRFRRRYLAYHRIDAAKKDSGALPPDPRSLPPSRTPAEVRKREGHAQAAAQPSAVRPANGRSGRTPAEPCPPDGEQDPTVKKPWRPPPEHPWRKKFLSYKKHNRTVLSSETTGHS
jgi:hypothetical protein